MRILGVSFQGLCCMELGVCIVLCTTFIFFFLRGENVREIDKSDVSMAFIRQQVTPAGRTMG
jgi:hypothetical protein